MKNSHYVQVTRLIGYIMLMEIVIIIISAIGSYIAWNATNDNMKMYACDGYSQDKASAPEYCNPMNYGK